MRTNGTVRGTLAVLSLMMMPAAAHAQCPGGARQLGDIGITQLECDCVIAPPTAEAQWQFMTEPGIAPRRRRVQRHSRDCIRHSPWR